MKLLVQVLRLFIFLFALVVIVHFVFFKFYIKDEIPSKISKGVLAAQFEVFDQDIFFTNGVSDTVLTRKLMVTDMNSKLKGAKYLGVKNIETMKRGGRYLYLLCEDNNLAVYDMESRKCIAEVNLRTEIDGMKKNGMIEYSLLFANEEGGFAVMNNEEENWIILIDSAGKIEILEKLTDMCGNIKQLTAAGEYIFFSYGDNDENKTGTYCYSRETNEVIKRSSKTSSSDEWLFPDFVWEGHYGFLGNGDKTVYLIPFDGKEPREIDFKYSSHSVYVDGDYLYRGQWKGLERYNLKTGEFEVSNKDKNYGSVIKIVDGKVYLAQCVTLETYFYRTKIYVEDLDTYRWASIN